MTCDDNARVSSRGTIACLSKGGFTVGSASGPARHVTPSTPLGELIAWTPDDRAILFYQRGRVPQVVRQVDVVTGSVSDVKKLGVIDPSGIWRIHPVRFSRDGKTIAYSVSRRLDDLYVYKKP